ncbi:MAG: UDP-N-acetylmuramoyl-L-alanyl-D-glutamate--2,6-diaminopimelate ligase [Lachnospiraceae bacterium]|nr:UDP-N-acetylmuramoyl-L-alanyl-D-glutamate--2,6-diaminopimelate ligase [Lachnospiraceae bacterium]
MKQLKQLAERLDYTCLQGSMEKEITDIIYDSRKAVKDSLFVCIKGTVVDGHGFAAEVAAKGATVLVVSEDVEAPADVTVLKVKDTRYALALLSAAYFDYPAESLKVIGVTGTKGKTTTTYMVKSILEGAGYRVGLIGTIETVIGEQVIPSANTTPESYLVQKYFRDMLDASCDCCVMEVSSQGLMMHRTAGFQFEIGIFTNIEPDHIGPGEHASFEEYMACKGLLFRQCRIGIVNADDVHYQDILKGHTCQVETFGLSETADLYASDIRLVHKPGYLGVAYHVSGCLDFDVEVDVPGRFSVYNSLTAIAICRHFQVRTDVMRQALKGAKTKGRIEMVKVSDEFTLMIDYAHNAMSLKSLLTTLREYEPGRLICLFGCGGNRARARRFEMGEVSGNMADLTIITSDNPRDEEPQAIIDDIKTGIHKTNGRYVEIIDRKEAIRYAITHGEPGDVIVLAGKGHEDYQEIRGVKYPMDERVLIAEVLQEIRVSLYAQIEAQ